MAKVGEDARRERQLLDNIQGLQDQKRRIADAITSAEQKIAMIRATKIGLKLGSVISYKQTVGYRPNQREVTKRFKVTKIYMKSYGNGLSVWGTTIKKDGTDGELHEIWRYFVVEP